MDRVDVFARLAEACRLAGSQKAWAEAQGLSLGYVNDVLNARRDPGPKILDALGIRMVVTYVDARNTNTPGRAA